MPKQIEPPPKVNQYSTRGFWAPPKGQPGSVVGIDNHGNPPEPQPGDLVIFDTTLFRVVKPVEKTSGLWKFHVLRHDDPPVTVR